MKPINNWEKVQASDNDFRRPEAGGYICEIIRATDVQEKEYLRIEYDIAEGEYKGYWQETAERFGWWGGDFYRSYKDSALGMFKGFTNSVEASNANYNWDWNEKALEGKLIGIILGEEEYVKNDGSVGTRLKVRSTKSVQDIKDGRFRIPKKKTLDEGGAAGSTTSAPAGMVAYDADLPF